MRIEFVEFNNWGTTKLYRRGIEIPQAYFAYQGDMYGVGETRTEAIANCFDEMLKIEAERMNVHNS